MSFTLAFHSREPMNTPVISGIAAPQQMTLSLRPCQQEPNHDMTTACQGDLYTFTEINDTYASGLGHPRPNRVIYSLADQLVNHGGIAFILLDLCNDGWNEVSMIDDKNWIFVQGSKQQIVKLLASSTPYNLWRLYKLGTPFPVFDCLTARDAGLQHDDRAWEWKGYWMFDVVMGKGGSLELRLQRHGLK